jgi:hypothetical protein
LLSLLQRILPLPIKFDQNEWFIILNTVLGYTWVLFFPKRYPRVISVLVILFSVFISILIDHAVASPPLNLYDINDRKEYELFDVFTYFMYTPYALLCVYLYDKFNPKGLYFTAYIIGWSLLSLGFERIAVKLHVFTFYNWNSLYSFSFYLASVTLYLCFFRFILNYFNEDSSKKTARWKSNHQEGSR